MRATWMDMMKSTGVRNIVSKTCLCLIRCGKIDLHKECIPVIWFNDECVFISTDYVSYYWIFAWISNYNQQSTYYSVGLEKTRFRSACFIAVRGWDNFGKTNNIVNTPKEDSSHSLHLCGFAQPLFIVCVDACGPHVHTTVAPLMINSAGWIVSVARRINTRLPQ